MRVLLVEDEKLIREGLRLTTPWDELGLEVVGEASTGEEGIQKIVELQPDIVITDVKMQGMSGLEMMEKLADKISCEYIILSGYDEFSYAKKAMYLGVHSYLLKPVDDEELRESLEQAIHRVQEKKLLYDSLSRHAEISVKDTTVDFRNLQDKYLDKACWILRERFRENLTLKSVADELFISDSYLGKLFKSRTDFTFLEMLTFYRMKKAVELLQNTDMKVYEISYAIGYSDSRYFSRLFRKITGLKPMELKNGCPLASDNILNNL